MSGKPVIAIDPGHNCAPDIGASYQQYREDKIVLEVARELSDICKQSGIRTIDCLPESARSIEDSLRQRCDRANKNGATIYVSIHCNAAEPTEGARGCETYAISTAGKAIAGNINRQLTKLGFKNRGVKETLDAGVAPYVVRNTNAIAVLVEICFVDAAEDTNILDRVGIKQIARSLYNGLTHGSNYEALPQNLANDPVVIPQRSLLVDAAKWYKGMPHQTKALQLLEHSLTDIQLTDFKAAYSPHQPSTKPIEPKQTVVEWIKNGNGSTKGVEGLSNQIVESMGKNGLVKFSHPRFKAASTCDPFFHSEVAGRLNAVLEVNPKLVMHCNSAYRSPVRQLVLREFFERGIHGISAAAHVGTGSHEKGTAIDLNNADEWRAILIKADWVWQGVGDPMHFEISEIISGVPTMAILAYQRLANQHGHNLTVDGQWGAKTKASMLSAPASGW